MGRTGEDSMSDFDTIVRSIDSELEAMARDVIRRHLDLMDAANRHFLYAPDAREQHQTRWHQWGILTHTRLFLRQFAQDIPEYLAQWQLWDPVDKCLRRPIDGVSRWDLLRVAILLHDIGKFAARTQGPHRFHFVHHEALSGQIIRQEIDLARFGLTPGQIEYVATTAEDHFVLGIVRKRAREQGTYDLDFVQGDQFVQVVRDVKRKHPDDFVEIGVLFLGDSLAKVDPVTGPLDAVSQYGINIDVAHRYLHIVLSNPQ